MAHKLLILTSRNEGEISLYWGCEYPADGIMSLVDPTESALYRSNGQWDFENKISKLVTTGGTVILHDMDPIDGKYICKEGKKSFTIYQYSTQNNETRNHLWSWDGNSEWTPPVEPLLPFDKLNAALRITDEDMRNEAVGKARNEIIEWVEKKKKEVDKLETALEFLHECLAKKPKDLTQLKGFVLDSPISLSKDGEKNEKNLKTLFGKLNANPLDDISSFESFRDGVLKMAGVK